MSDSGTAAGDREPAADEADAAERIAARDADEAAEPVTVLEPPSGLPRIDFRELWRYRELFLFLAARDIKVRYKQTVIGATWAILQPLLTMVVFNVLFSALMGRGNEPTVEGIPYAVSTYCALVPWQLFAQSLERSSKSLVANQRLITKVYFPRLVIPGSAILAALVDFGLAFAVLLAMMLAMGVVPGLSILALPLFVLLAVATSLAVGLWLSALNALYRDFEYVVPFLVQMWMFVTPVVYTTESVMGNQPAWVRILYGLNPMAGVVEGFRWALLGKGDAPGAVMLASAVAVAAILTGGLFYFRRMERIFADWI